MADKTTASANTTDLSRRMNWQAVGAFVALVGMGASIVKWGAQIDARVAATHEILDELRAQEGSHFAQTNGALADSAAQRDKMADRLDRTADRLEGRLSQLDQDLKVLLLHAIPPPRPVSLMRQAGVDDPATR